MSTGWQLQYDNYSMLLSSTGYKIPVVVLIQNLFHHQETTSLIPLGGVKIGGTHDAYLKIYNVFTGIFLLTNFY
jgi:hypothetical protein